MRNIAVFTGTRAEYGLLYWLIYDIQQNANLTLQLIASGSHLSPEFGNTYTFIEQDGFTIDAKVEMLVSSDTPVGVVKSLGLAVLGYGDALARLQPDVMVILGDRYEALAMAQTAMLMRIPILHIHGGEITEGAYDDSIRHAITKLSFMHCTSTECSRRRVIQLGETPERVKNVGAIGLDHVTRSKLMSLDELSSSLNFKLHQPYFVVSYHPETLSNEPPDVSFQQLLDALDAFPDYQIILTYPNADEGSRSIIPLLKTYAAKQSQRVFAITTLGHIRYLSAIKYAAAVIGNSSSGIIEVPMFSVPTVNIGARQKGRVAANSTIHCSARAEDIKMAINKAINRDPTLPIHHPYGQGNSSQQIINILNDMPLDRIKQFHDLIESTPTK